MNVGTDCAGIGEYVTYFSGTRKACRYGIVVGQPLHALSSNVLAAKNPAIPLFISPFERERLPHAFAGNILAAPVAPVNT